MASTRPSTLGTLGNLAQIGGVFKDSSTQHSKFACKMANHNAISNNASINNTPGSTSMYNNSSNDNGGQIQNWQPKNMDKLVSDVLEFVRGMMDEGSSMDVLAQNFTPSNQPTIHSHGMTQLPLTQIKQEIQDLEYMDSHNLLTIDCRGLNGESQSSPDNGSIGGTPPFTPDVDLTAPPSPTDSLTPRYAMLPESPCLPSSSVGHTDNYMCAQSPGVSTSSSYEITSSTMVDDKSLVKKCINSSGGEIRRCQICNDTASGFHYGVWSCEGCKAFFKRSLQGPVEYVCPATNNCTIDKHRRKSCQACRLRKCLERGMTRGNPRKEKGCRAPRQMKRKAQMLQEDLEEKEKMSRSGDDLSVDEFTIPISGYHPNESETLVSANNMTGSSPPPIENSVPQDKGMDMPPIHPLVEHLMSIDPPVRFSNHDTTLPDTEVSLFTSLLKLADSELLDVINWAKSLPGYMDLKLQERIKVLEACWLEVLILGLMWRSMPHQDVLAFAPDLHFGRERFITPRLQSTLEKNLSLAAMMRQYKVNREEMVLLRMTILLNAGAIMNLDCKDKLQSIQDQVHEAMVYTLVTRYRVGYNRMSQLLLILPHIKQVAMEGFQTISEIMSEKNVPIMNLLREVIDGQFSLKKELTSIEPPYASKTSHPSPHKESSDSNVNMSQSLQAGKNDSIQNMFQ